MEEKFIEEMLKKNMQSIVTVKVEEEIEKQIKTFVAILESRKDEFIAEIMKGIRILHERDAASLGMNYKIIFENIVRLEK